jgi:hypothetical protein
MEKLKNGKANESALEVENSKIPKLEIYGRIAMII